MNRLAPLIELAHHRWALPVLAVLHQGRGAKFITMVNSLGVSRDSLRRTLHALTAAGLVRKNPGYGHPMRPEYLLTPRGVVVGAQAVPLVEALRKRSDALCKKWSLPTLAVLTEEPLNFNALKAALSDTTSRALSLTLKELEAEGLVSRTVQDTHPPTVSYKLSPGGRRLAPLIAGLIDVL